MLKKELRARPFGLRLEENRITQAKKCPRRLLEIPTYSHSHSTKVTFLIHKGCIIFIFFYLDIIASMVR